MQSIHVKYNFFVHYFLWFSYFDTVKKIKEKRIKERLIISHLFVTFCHQLCREKNIQRLENICIVQMWKYLGLG